MSRSPSRFDAALRVLLRAGPERRLEYRSESKGQVGTGRYAFGTVDAALVAEREMPGRVQGHEAEHTAGQLVVVDACIPR